MLNSYSYVQILCARLWKLKLAKVAEREMDFFMAGGGDILNVGGDDGVMRLFSVSVVML